MADTLEELQKVYRLRGDTYSSAEVLGLIGRAADEIERSRAALRIIAGYEQCFDNLMGNADLARVTLALSSRKD